MYVARTSLERSRVLLSLLLVLIPLSSEVPIVHADTPVSGPIVTDTTWTLANSPYIVVDSVSIYPNVTLTIDPGVTVKFQSDRGLLVDGALVARGTASQSIDFTSAEAVPQRGGWGMIQFTNRSVDATFDGDGNYVAGSILQYCVVEYGTRIESNLAGPFINHCTIRENQAGILVGGDPWYERTNTPIRIMDNTITHNTGYGIQVIGPLDSTIATQSYIVGNTVADNESTGIWAWNVGLVANNVVTGNTDTQTGGMLVALVFSGPALDYVIRDNTITNNTVTDPDWYGGGMTIVGNVNTTKNLKVEQNVVSQNVGGQGGGIYAEYAVLSGNTVTYNEGSDGGGVHAAYSTIENNDIGYNTTRWHTRGGGLFVQASKVSNNTLVGNQSWGAGGLYAEGSSIQGNVVSENRSEANTGGIQVESSAVLSNTITFNSTLCENCPAGLWAMSYSGGSYKVQYNTIAGNTSPQSSLGGGAHLFGPAEVHYNLIYGNLPYDVTVRLGKDISGTLNYWGTTDLVTIDEHIYDWHDDSSVGRFFCYPFLESPDNAAPLPPPMNFDTDWQVDSVLLSWEPIPGATAGWGYKVYYDTDDPNPPYEGTGLDQGDSAIDAGNVTTYMLTGLQEGVTYYVTVTAYDTAGREGWYSIAADNLALLRHAVYLPLVLR